MTTPTFATVFRGSTNQSIPNGTWTTVLFNIIETDGSSNVIYNSTTGTFTAPVSGWYDIEAQITWASAVAGALRVIQGESTTLPAFIRSTSTVFPLISIKYRTFLGQNEYVRIQARQPSGGPINILATIDPGTLGQPGKCTSASFTLVKSCPSVTFNGF